jgi:hypothetical protein
MMRWRRRRKQVQVDVTPVQHARARREEAQRKLESAHKQLAHDDANTIRPLKSMVRENHITDHLDSIIRKVRSGEPGGSY